MLGAGGACMRGRGGEGVGTPHNGLNGGRGTPFQASGQRKGRILLVKKVYERLGKSVIGVCEKT